MSVFLFLIVEDIIFFFSIFIPFYHDPIRIFLFFFAFAFASQEFHPLDFSIDILNTSTEGLQFF